MGCLPRVSGSNVSYCEAAVLSLPGVGLIASFISLRSLSLCTACCDIEQPWTKKHTAVTAIVAPNGQLITGTKDLSEEQLRTAQAGLRDYMAEAKSIKVYAVCEFISSLLSVAAAVTIFALDIYSGPGAIAMMILPAGFMICGYQHYKIGGVIQGHAEREYKAIYPLITPPAANPAPAAG